MIRYILTRLVTLIPILLGVSILVFGTFHLVPGDVVDIMMGDEVTGDPKAAEQLRIYMGLDKPVYVQYWKWLKNAVRGDLGKSMTSGNQVIDDILGRLPVNIELMLIAMGFVIFLGIPLGMLCSLCGGSHREHQMHDHSGVCLRHHNPFLYRPNDALLGP